MEKTPKKRESAILGAVCARIKDKVGEAEAIDRETPERKEKLRQFEQKAKISALKSYYLTEPTARRKKLLNDHFDKMIISLNDKDQKARFIKISKGWEDFKPQEIIDYLNEIEMMLHTQKKREPKKSIKPLSEKINWQGADEELKRQIIELKEAGFIGFIDENDVISGQETPCISKKHPTHTVLYIFAVWHNETMIQGFFDLNSDKRGIWQIHPASFIEESFSRNKGKSFIAESISRRKNRVFKDEEFKKGTLQPLDAKLYERIKKAILPRT